MITAEILNAQLPFARDAAARRKEWKKASAELLRLFGKIIVLDDDPTGSQTVYGLPVFTGLDDASLKAALDDPAPVVYILTNSRSLNAGETEKLHKDLIDGLKTHWTKDNPFLILSRSDSTLRGHYPLETEILSGGSADGEILVPFFLEGGRYTLGDIHYVREGEVLIPAGETEFAKDSSFSFTHSDLKKYVAEKTGDRVSPGEVLSIGLEDLRSGGNTAAEKLKSAAGYRRIIVNAVSYDDLKSFLVSYADAVAAGKRFIFRCAASFVKVIAGLDERDFLVRPELIAPEDGNGPGLIIAGSYVGKTSRQLKALIASGRCRDIRFNIRTALHGEELEKEIERCGSEADALLRAGETVCLFTENAGSRRFLTAEEGEEGLTDLELSARISSALVRVASSIDARPSFVLTKGGITSHDIACKALRIQKADVLGQIVPGVPVWRCGSEARWPGIPLIIFPGNVGNDESLAEVVYKLLP